MAEDEPLENPIWEALTTVHAGMALAHGDARRYPGDVSPLAALREPSERAFEDLKALVSSEETVAFFTASPVYPPAGWQVSRERWIDQMVFEDSYPPERIEFDLLGEKDVPDMMTLTAATEPGPFCPRTLEMGRYIGVRANGQLASMAGERLRSATFTEISAVCTHPDHRGHGYAGALVRSQVAYVLDGGLTPMLHVKSENGAKLLYEKLGFRTRRPIRLTVVTRT